VHIVTSMFENEEKKDNITPGKRGNRRKSEEK
jgi:hypothetical protein